MKPHKLQIGDEVIFNHNTKNAGSSCICYLKYNNDLRSKYITGISSYGTAFHSIPCDISDIPKKGIIIDISQDNPNIILIETLNTKETETIKIAFLRRSLLLYKESSIKSIIRDINNKINKIK